MENIENRPPIARSGTYNYNIQFNDGKPTTAVPKCVKEYSSKPWPSQKELKEKQEQAFKRRKVGLFLYIFATKITLRAMLTAV